jgi:hypothetical protein
VSRAKRFVCMTGVKDVFGPCRVRALGFASGPNLTPRVKNAYFTPLIHNSYLYIKDAKSYFDEPREKLSSRPLCGRDKIISRSSKDFVAKVYTTFCVQRENLYVIIK